MLSSSILYILLRVFSAVPDNPAAAQTQVILTQNGKAQFLVFSGSDWCKNCIVFRKQVLESAEFKEFADKNLKLTNADFPQRIQLPKDVVERNEALAEKYNPKGEFPKLILLLPDGAVKEVHFTDQTPAAFVLELKKMMTVQ